MFIPVQITTGAGAGHHTIYDRRIDTSAKFDILGRQVEDMTEPLTLIGGDLHTQIAAAFATEGATGASGKWTVLSPAYGQWKQQHSAGIPILVGLRPRHRGTRHHPTRPQTYMPSGAMRRELLDPLAMHVNPRRLLYAPTSDIAGFHETGTSRMPARPPVDLTPTFLHSVDRRFVVWLNQMLERMKL